MWIYEDTNWPCFFWDMDILGTKLADIRYRQGRLIGQMVGLGFDFKQYASLDTLTNDVIKTSAIEGELLNLEEVRSSIAQKLGIHIDKFVSVSRNVDGIVDIMLDATQNFSKPLEKTRLFNWHAALFPTGRSGMSNITVGKWRTLESGPMQVVSGPIGREKIHYEAPSADRLEYEIQVFLDWFNNPVTEQTSIDPIIKAGIAHLWFLTIHPFEDGNGRIARAIGDMALARADGLPERFYSLSTQIELERKDYYNQLEIQQRGSLDITNWLEWFLSCLSRALLNAEKSLAVVIFKAKLWDKINENGANERQRFIINKMLEDDFQGYMNTSKYGKMAKCSNNTALRDIQDLEARGIFVKNESRGRSTSYRLYDMSK